MYKRQLQSCTAMFGSAGTGLAATSYLSEDSDMLGAEATYAGMEADLQHELDNYESLHPGYDEDVYKRQGRVPTSAAALLMVFAMLPGFLMALYERHGQPLEVVVWQIVQCCFLMPKERPYQTNNAYTALVRQRQMEKEVNAIVPVSYTHLPPTQI